MRELDPQSFDRTDFLPLHEGPEVLPHDLIFYNLHHLAVAQNEVVVRDTNANHVASHRQFLSDIVACRNALRQTLDLDTLEALQQEREVCILILSHGYEFVVAFFATLAIGAIAVPLSLMITVEEASYFAKITKAHAILCGEAFVDLVNQIQHEPKLRSQFKVVPSRQFCMTPVVNPVSFTFCSGRTPDQNKPALVIFTSGSTGPPKGAVVRRYNIYVVAMNIVRRAGISKGYTAVQLLPMHQSTGLLINTIPVILGGGSIEFNEAEFNAVNVWERFRQGGITSFSGVPVMFRLLLSHWENVLSKLSDPEREPYQNAISGMREFNSSGFPLPRDIGTKWVVMTRGVPILERYGGTEFGPVYASLPGMNVPRGSVGMKVGGVESKLSNGSSGEVLVRGPFVFSKYINDLETTKRAFTKEGYFATGDIARREGEFHFIVGRSSVDILKSGGQTFSALDVEQDLLEHPLISEAIVVGIDDEEYGECVAAAIVLKDPSGTLSLEALRSYMRSRTSACKLPTILRVVPELRKTGTMKIPKLLLKRELFETGHPDVQKLNRRDSKI